nr:LuxR C-terminal-related transcriptional regulator [Leifsonia naganoensis]
MGADLLADRLPSGAGHDAGTEREAASAPSLFADLSEREREVAALILEGLSYTQVAKELFITRSTVSFHLSRIYAKTGTASRHELVEAARRSGD